MGIDTSQRLTASKLKLERECLGLTQEALAAELGVTRNTVARWEMGLYPVPHWAAYFIANILPGIMEGGKHVSANKPK